MPLHQPVERTGFFAPAVNFRRGAAFTFRCPCGDAIPFLPRHAVRPPSPGHAQPRGEITYRHVEGTTYEVTITTYTKSSVVADRPWLSLRWGDEGSTAGQDSLPRINGPLDGGGNPTGELLDGDVRLNLYRGLHTYAGPGIYTLVVEDPNRNDGVLNIPGSVDVPFCITSQLLIIDPEAGQNDSPILLAPAIENACIGQRWEHNPGAYDPDGDSLSYDLVACAGFDCLPIEGFVQPNEVDGAGGNSMWNL